MKSVLILVGGLLFIFLTPQCGSIRSNKVGFDRSAKNESNNLILIFCDKDSAYFDIKSRSLKPNNISIYYCLRNKAFNGDTASIRQIAILISLKDEPFSIFNKRLRGDIIFKAALDKLNNFEFIPGPGGDMDFYTYFGSYARVLYEMIESIDGISVTNYLQIHYPEKFKTDLTGIELFSPEYMQKSGKIKWEVIKEAYDQGLIKLKDFGQE